MYNISSIYGGMSTEGDDTEMSEKLYRFVKREVKKREDIEIVTIGGVENDEIRYDKMQGRPSIKIELQGKEYDCLLDTGAKINVMSKEIYEKLEDVDLWGCDERLRCANNSHMDIVGKISVETLVGSQKRLVRFTVVEEMSPDIIGGIEMQKQFGFSLRRDEEIEEPQICNIEARFGRKINKMERLERARKNLLLQKDEELERIIIRNEDAFMADNWDIGCTKLITHKIETKGGPINTKPWRQPMHLEGKIDEGIKNMYENGIIRKCNSPWNTPLICIWKKERKDVRLCLDFRRLNAITERQAYPMPNIAELLDKLEGTKYFSTIDLGNAYYQVMLEKSSQEKTAFSTKTGQFCFTRMPFGIAAAPGTFQELMTKVLDGSKGTMVYLDDIMVFTDNVKDHYRILDEVFGRIREAGLRVNPEKCHLLRQEVKFLGHIVDKNGIKPDASKIEAIRAYERPKCIKKLRGFLGMCNYYRRFIENYAKKARALEELIGMNNVRLIWTDKCNKAFSDLKEALMKTPVLRFPDITKTFILDTDASFDTIGAVLAQRDENGKERVIAYGSHAMNNHERGYCITRKELLAIYYFCNHFKHYLYGKRFELRTDHKAITFMLNTTKPVTPQFQTWINYLSGLDMDLQFRQGSRHTNADMLSRPNCGTCTQCQTEHEEPKTGKRKTRQLDMISEDNGCDWQRHNDEIRQLSEEIDKGKSTEFIKSDNVVRTKTGKIWIPKERRQEMIRYAHRLLSHAGTEKVIKYIGNFYDMEKLRESVTEIMKNCEACQRNKVVTIKTKEETIQLSATEPFEKIYIDICGPFKETFRKKRYILAIIDQFSRYISLTAIGRQDEETIRRVVNEKWILRFGAPKEVHVDCGKCFEARVFTEWAKASNIKICFSSPYHHNTNGIIERQFRTIRDYLNASAAENKHPDWEERTPEIEFALNATVQKTLGTSPAELILGKKICRERWFSKDVGQNKQRTESEPKDQTITKREFAIGEEVLVKVETRTKDKERFEGPYKIAERIHDRRYRLCNQEGKVMERNVEKLKKFLKEGDVR